MAHSSDPKGPLKHARSSTNSSPSPTSDQDKPDAQDKQSTWAKVKGFIWPDWLSTAAKSSRMWKNWFRCMVATLAAFVLILDTKCEST